MNLLKLKVGDKQYGLLKYVKVEKKSSSELISNSNQQSKAV